MLLCIWLFSLFDSSFDSTLAWFSTYLGPRIGAEIRTVPGGHVGFIVQAERYLDLMETFLQRNGI